MATRIRLRRMGANKRPFYRVVVADQRSPRDGRFIENIGKYHPLDDPCVIEIDQERALHWLRVGRAAVEPGPQPDDEGRHLGRVRDRAPIGRARTRQGAAGEAEGLEEGEAEGRGAAAEPRRRRPRAEPSRARARGRGRAPPRPRRPAEHPRSRPWPRQRAESRTEAVATRTRPLPRSTGGETPEDRERPRRVPRAGAGRRARRGHRRGVLRRARPALSRPGRSRRHGQGDRPRRPDRQGDPNGRPCGRQRQGIGAMVDIED